MSNQLVVISQNKKNPWEIIGLNPDIIKRIAKQQLDKTAFIQRRKLLSISESFEDLNIVDDLIVFTNDQIIIPFKITIEGLDIDNEETISNLNQILLYKEGGYDLQLLTEINKSSDKIANNWSISNLQIEPKEDEKWQTVYSNLNDGFCNQMREILSKSDKTLGINYLLVTRKRSKDIDDDLIKSRALLKMFDQSKSDILFLEHLSKADLQSFCKSNLIIGNDKIKETPDYLVVDDCRYLRLLKLKRTTNQKVSTNFDLTLRKLGLDVKTLLRTRKHNSISSIEQFDKSSKNLKYQLELHHSGEKTLSPSELLRVEKLMNAEEESMEKLMDNERVELNIEYLLLIESNSLEQLKIDTQVVINESLNHRLHFVTLINNQRPALDIFLNIKKTNLKFKMDNTADSNLLVALSPNHGLLNNTNGLYLGHSIMANTHLFANVLYTPDKNGKLNTMNRSFCRIGASGGGKTESTKTDIRQYLIKNISTIILDIKHNPDYTEFVKQLGGDVLRVTPDEFAYNIFDKLNTAIYKGDKKEVINQIDQLSELVMDLTGMTLTDTHKCFFNAYNKAVNTGVDIDFKLLESVVPKKYQDHFIIFTSTTGRFTGCFDKDTNVNFDNPLTSIELGEMSENAKDKFMSIASYLLKNCIFKKGSPRQVILEEGHFIDPVVVDKLLRTVRSMDGGIDFNTQKRGDLNIIGKDNKPLIGTENFAVIKMFKVPKPNVNDFIGWDESDILSLQSLGIGDYIIESNNDLTKCHIPLFAD